MGYENGYTAYLVYFPGAITFFITTLEEYYTHYMYFPLINGAAEGTFGVGLFFLIASVFGPEVYTTPIAFDLNLK